MLFKDFFWQPILISLECVIEGGIVTNLTMLIMASCVDKVGVFKEHIAKKLLFASVDGSFMTQINILNYFFCNM